MRPNYSSLDVSLDEDHKNFPRRHSPRRVLLISIVVLGVLLSGCFVHREFQKRDALKTHFRLMELLVAGDGEGAYGLTTSEYGAAEIFAWPHDGGMFEFFNGPSFYYRKEEGQWRFTGETNHYLD